MGQKKEIVIKTMPFSTILFFIFLVLKLTGFITWPWLWVTAPLWIPLAIGLFIFLFVFISVFISIIIVTLLER